MEQFVVRKAIVFDSIKQREKITDLLPWGTFNRFMLRFIDELIELGSSEDGRNLISGLVYNKDKEILPSILKYLSKE